MPIKVWGRVADRRLSAVQRIFPRQLRRVLKEKGYGEKYLLICSGLVLRTSVDQGLLVFRSRIHPSPAEQEIMIEVFRRRDTIGVMYCLMQVKEKERDAMVTRIASWIKSGELSVD